jgi:hypothetical protein
VRKKIRRWVARLLSRDMHKKRQELIKAMAEGVLEARSLVPADVGRNLPGQATEKAKIKRAYEFGANEKVDPGQLFSPILSLIANGSGRSEPSPKRLLFAFDWTTVGKFEVLTAAIVTRHRALPFYFKAVDLQETRRGKAELDFIDAVKRLCPPWLELVALGDRGFDGAPFLRYLGERFSFVVRCSRGIGYRNEGDVDFRFLDEKELKERERVYDLGACDFTKEHRIKLRIVAFFGAKAKEAWFLTTNMKDRTARAIVDMYARRFEIEEAFKDLKDMRAGLHFKQLKVKTPDRLARFLVLGMLVYLFLVAAGLYGEIHKLQYSYQANTSRKRVLAVWRLGLRLIRRVKIPLVQLIAALCAAPLQVEVL